MTNHPWRFSIEETRRRLNFGTLLAVNDFAALAMALPYLGATDYEQLGGEKPISSSVMGLVGAGTGLGVGGLLSVDGRWTTLNSEGGHSTFSPADERELAILQYCWRRYQHVSAERLVSGPGIALIHEALSEIGGVQNGEALETAEIVRRAVERGDALCEETVACFCAMLGTVASNVAITLGALGGLYIGGGIVPRLGKYFMQSQFRTRFENKGRFREYLSKVPVYVITAQYPAFVGVAAILRNYLGKSTSTMM
jgi:glucokinase